MLKEIIDQTNTTWSVYTTNNRKSNPNKNQHVKTIGPIHGHTDQVPHQTTPNQKIFPVELINLIAHNDPRDRISSRKHSSTHKSILCSGHTQI